MPDKPDSIEPERRLFRPGVRYWWETPDTARVKRAQAMEDAGMFKDIALPVEKPATKKVTRPITRSLSKR